MLMATSDGAGHCDASPKGGQPGFVKVLDDRHLAIPDLSGNNLLDSLANIVSRASVGLLVLIPGLDETLRVNGHARITTDPELLEPLAVNDKVPRSGILISAEEVYFHCGKALIRSDLWNPEKHVARDDLPTQVAKATSGDSEDNSGSMASHGRLPDSWACRNH